MLDHINNSKHIEQYLQEQSSILVIQGNFSDKDKFINGMYDKVVIRQSSYEDVSNSLNWVVNKKPNVIVIENYDLKNVCLAVQDSYDTFSENYILEAVNSEYILVRRDCYSKVCSK